MFPFIQPRRLLRNDTHLEWTPRLHAQGKSPSSGGTGNPSSLKRQLVVVRPQVAALVRFGMARCRRPMIDAVHWDVLASRTVFVIEPSFVQLVIWAAPVHYDTCLAKAGFEHFADDAGDDANPLALRVTRCLSNLGELRVRHGERLAMPTRVSWWHGLRGTAAIQRTPAESLADAADDDNFPPCVVDVLDVDNVTAATIVSSDGHPLLWIGLRPSSSVSIEDFVSCVAAGLPTHRTTLSWDDLKPSELAKTGGLSG